jgi:hypothetical protein
LSRGSSGFPQRIPILESTVDDGSGDGRIEGWEEGFGVGEEDVERDGVRLLSAVDFEDAKPLLAVLLVALLRGLEFAQPVSDGAFGGQTISLSKAVNSCPWR